jgi:uncharacterized protein YndB with AHSA1/START domain
MSEQVMREVLVPAPIEAVWCEIVAGGWLADEVELELRPGGEARFRSAEGERRGWVEEARAPLRLTFWWELGDEPATRVELTLAREGEEATRVRVSETRPLDALDLVATPLPGSGGSTYGPVLLAA